MYILIYSQETSAQCACMLLSPHIWAGFLYFSTQNRNRLLSSSIFFLLKNVKNNISSIFWQIYEEIILTPFNRNNWQKNGDHFVKFIFTTSFVASLCLRGCATRLEQPDHQTWIGFRQYSLFFEQNLSQRPLFPAFSSSHGRRGGVLHLYHCCCWCGRGWSEGALALVLRGWKRVNVCQKRR